MFAFKKRSIKYLLFLFVFRYNFVLLYNKLEVFIMSILNQPFQGQLGNMLIQKLDDNYKIITIFSAFAKNSGVLRLRSALERFKKNHIA